MAYFPPIQIGACAVYMEAAVTSITIRPLGTHLQHAPHFPDMLSEFILNVTALQILTDLLYLVV